MSQLVAVAWTQKQYTPLPNLHKKTATARGGKCGWSPRADLNRRPLFARLRANVQKATLSHTKVLLLDMWSICKWGALTELSYEGYKSDLFADYLITVFGASSRIMTTPIPSTIPKICIMVSGSLKYHQLTADNVTALMTTKIVEARGRDIPIMNM